MATRMIATSMWQDKEFRKLKSIETRYLWVYLLSCTMSKSCGIFHLPIDMIAFESKLTEQEIEKSLKELEMNGFCYYSKKSEEIAIYNYPKYNISNMGKPMIDCVSKDLSLVEDRSLVDRVILSLYDYKKSLGEEHKAMLVDSMIYVYQCFSTTARTDEDGEIKEKTIFKESNTKTITNNNTNTNSDTIDESCHESSNDTRKIEELDYANMSDDTLF